MENKMDSNTEKPLNEEEITAPDDISSEPIAGEGQAAEEPQVDKWYTSEQILGDEPLSQVGTPVEPLKPEIVTPSSAYTPPPGAPASPPRKNNTTTIVLIVLLVLLCICCLCIFLTFSLMGDLLTVIYQLVVDILNAIFGGMIQFE
jgi:hypothetical protein